jgi:cytochrome c
VRFIRNTSVPLAVIGVSVYVGAAVMSGQRPGGPPPKSTRTTPLAAALPSAARPDDTRFVPVPVVRDGELDEPMTFSVARNGKVYIAERKGGLKVYDQAAESIKTVAVIPTNHAYLDPAGKPVREAEEGLIGLALDPDFDQNHWIYLRYADPKEPKHVLSRWEVRDDRLVEGSRKDLLSFMVQRQQCCHVGGGITFDAHGNLFMTNGSNSPDDVSAATPDDLRGKILRIHPEPDGTYTIPAGNLYPPGAPGTRAEIYAMGVRNPWRPTVDSKTGWLYWGEIGDGWDEFNQARGPAFFGWPYWDGDNVPRQIGAATRPPIRADVPPPQPALISFDSSPGKIPALGAGTRCAVGGPIYHRADFDASAERPWPGYFEGKWLVTDCVRSWIMAVTMTGAGDYQSVEQIVPHYRPATPLDMKFGPDGDLYVLEYGVNFFMRNETARLMKIQYHGGNRTPTAHASANRTGGTVPFTVTLSAAGSKDPDGEPLKFKWLVDADSGGGSRTFAQANPVVPFTKDGVYTATLTVTDPKGAASSKPVTIVAGNAAPDVAISIEGNDGFYVPGKPFTYSIHVTDREDAEISPDRVALSIDYVPERFDVESIRLRNRPVDATTRFAVGSALMEKTNCRACHNTATRTVGPSMSELAAKYKPDGATLDALARKVRAGGTGVWGNEQTMPPHPSLTLDEARTIVRLMLSVNEQNVRTLPLTGTYTPTVPPGESGAGMFLIHAAYTDNGRSGLPVLTSDAVKVLRSPLIMAKDADIRRGVTPSIAFGGFETGLVAAPNSYLGFKKIDLSGVRKLSLWIATPAGPGGSIEIRLGSPVGSMLGAAVIQGAGQAAAGGSDVPAAPARGAAAADASGRGSASAAGRGAAIRRGGAYGGIEGGYYDNVGSAAAVVARPPTATVPITSVRGVRDVYLVFKNPAANAKDALLTLNAIKFILEE